MPRPAAPPPETSPVRPATPPSAWPDQLLFRIGDVADLLGVETHVVRYWQTEFREVRPERSSTGRFLYARNALQRLWRIRQLLYDEKYTIAGAKAVLGAERELDKRSSGKAPARKPVVTTEPGSRADEKRQAQLQAQLERSHRENRGLTARLQALETELLALRGKVAEQLGGVESQAQRWRGQVHDLEVTLAAREQALAAKEADLIQRQEAVQGLLDAHEQILAERESALLRASTAEQELEALRQENDALMTSAAEAQAQLAHLEQRSSQSAAERDRLRHEAGAWLQVGMVVRQLRQTIA
jgi:DNA-binding transcriptional MerR regulator